MLLQLVYGYFRWAVASYNVMSGARLYLFYQGSEGDSTLFPLGIRILLSCPGVMLYSFYQRGRGLNIIYKLSCK